MWLLTLGWYKTTVYEKGRGATPRFSINNPAVVFPILGVSRVKKSIGQMIIIHKHKFIRSPMGVEHSGEGIYGRRSHNAKLFERIEHSGIR